MYDKYSLAHLLQRVGFVDMSVEEAITSRVPGWVGFGLDTASDGSVYKPGSLFMEAVKPAKVERGL
jgi:hypothetical protein